MPRLCCLLAVALSAPLAVADVPGVATRPQLSLSALPEKQVCAGVAAPQPWRDASNALFFATGATARLDAHELWAGVLVPLVALRQVGLGLHLVVLGDPVDTQIRFNGVTWRPRWPFC
jgi:hypothetical protein